MRFTDSNSISNASDAILSTLGEVTSANSSVQRIAYGNR